MKRILLSLTSVALLAGPLGAFSQPRAPMPLKAEIVTEKLETMEIPRIRISGRRDIQMDYLDSFDVAKPKEESVLLTHRFLKDQQFALYVYPATSIRGEINQQNVADYLSRKREAAERNREFFEVITEPPPDDAPTKIRFLGAKPITIEYAIKREIDGEETRVIVQESWAELDGQVYMLRIEAPEDRFDGFFRACKSIANSMYFLN